MSVDPEKLMAVLERHASTVTLTFLCDLMPVVGMKLSVSLADDPTSEGGDAQKESPND